MDTLWGHLGLNVVGLESAFIGIVFSLEHSLSHSSGGGGVYSHHGLQTGLSCQVDSMGLKKDQYFPFKPTGYCLEMDSIALQL